MLDDIRRVRMALLHLKSILLCNECELVHDWAEEVSSVVMHFYTLCF